MFIRGGNYSLNTEILIGKFIDDKPIYRRVAEYTWNSTSLKVSYDDLFGISFNDIDNIIDLEIIMNYSTVQSNTYFGWQYYKSTDYLGYFHELSTNKLCLRSGSDWPELPFDCFLVLDYTKKID